MRQMGLNPPSIDTEHITRAQILIPLSQIKDAVGNEYGRPKDVVGEKRMAFTSLADTAFDVCFTNTMTGRGMNAGP